METRPNGLRLLEQLDVDLDLDVFADHHAAGLERSVVGEAEVFAIDRAADGRARTYAAPRIFERRRRSFDRQRDGFGHAFERQVTGNFVTIFAVLRDLGRLERHL